VSGVQNLTLDYEYGAQSAHLDEVTETDWNAYTASGGLSTERTGLMVVDNPCSDSLHSE
jgi:hypothetical protein